MIETVKREVKLLSVSDKSELSSTDSELLERAKHALKGAYAPYSKFHVAAAVLLENGIIVEGSNQENMAYPSGLCAERVAIFSASANYPGIAVKAISVTARTDEFKLEHPVMCCGACLQSVSEYEKRYGNQIRMILQGESGPIYIAEGTQTFLPFQFDGESLKKE